MELPRSQKAPHQACVRTGRGRIFFNDGFEGGRRIGELSALQQGIGRNQRVCGSALGGRFCRRRGFRVIGGNRGLGKGGNGKDKDKQKTDKHGQNIHQKCRIRYWPARRTKDEDLVYVLILEEFGRWVNW